MTPSSADQRRWYDFREGMSIEELATREQVKLATIERSLALMRAYTAQNSAESVELATRAHYLGVLPQVADVWRQGLEATTVIERTIVNPDTQKTENVWEEVPDVVQRLKATEVIRKFMEATQPKQPGVVVNANSSASANAGVQANLHGAGGAGALSSESIIRQIRQQRGLAAPAETAAADAEPEFIEERDMELADEMDEEEDDDEDEVDDEVLEGESDEYDDEDAGDVEGAE